MSKKTRKVVVMGGGTGTFPVVRALVHLVPDIVSVIAVSDSGGSTGRIRDEFGFQPVGDLRQALAALAEHESENWIRKVLLYRFEKGTGLRGHNLGNLILTALQDMTGDTTEALKIAAKIFRLEGKVIPATPANVQLEIEYQDGKVVVGEHTLDEKTTEPRQIKAVRLTPTAPVNPLAVAEIKTAKLIIIGPGDYYASLMPTLIPEGMKEALQETPAKILYIVNLMTRLTQTHGMTASQHTNGISEAIGRQVDYVLLNAEPIPQPVLDFYAQAQEFPVKDDLGNRQVIRVSLLAPQTFNQSSVDTAHRSVLRHDPDKLQGVLKKILRRVEEAEEKGTHREHA